MIKGTNLGNVLIAFDKLNERNGYTFRVTDDGYIIRDKMTKNVFSGKFIDEYLKINYKKKKKLSAKILKVLFLSLSDCTQCSDCVGCFSCSWCKNCVDCFMCKNCFSCERCRRCENCTSCKDCKECFNSKLVTHSCDLHECITCDKCNNLMACTNCEGCSFSKNLENCQNICKAENEKK